MIHRNRFAKFGVCGMVKAFCLLGGMCGFAAHAAPDPSAFPPLLAGYQLLYNLEFERAHQLFAAYEQAHADDPVAPVSDAAGALFSEFHRLGILEAQFFEDDKQFAARQRQTPDPAMRDRFQAALAQAESRAQLRLSSNGRDADALFALTLASGLRADYAALIEKHNLEALHDTKDAGYWADRLLAVDPACSDARVATGFSKYLIGEMSAPVRWLVRLGGIVGDRQAGMAELRVAAQHGRYLAPFARILLAIAYLREKDRPDARQLLVSLEREFPANPLFAREIARLDARP